VKEIRLQGTDINTTQLGFGCASLMRTSSRRERMNILCAAFDAGIRHFDLARMYGLGAVESEVGRFVRGKRDQVILTSKFGIDVRAGGQLRLVQGLARRVIAMFPALRNIVRRKSETLYVPRRYDSNIALKSIETSLGEIGTDYIDLFMLHEPAVEGVQSTDVLECLDNLQQKGVIRDYGVAGYPEDTVKVCEAVPELARVVQIPNDIIHQQLDAIRKKLNSAFITFSPFSESLGSIHGYLVRDADARRRWNETLDCDLTDKGAVAALLLAYCMADNPDGVTLFSSSRPAHIGRLLQMTEIALSGGMVSAFAGLVGSEIRPGVISDAAARRQVQEP
jgi:D-threo-aldose 1-dehydrogenase